MPHQSENRKPRRPLKNLRVLDLTNARSGPVAVRQLSDWGAEVIRVERVVSDQINEGLISRRTGGDFQNLHRNKRSIGLDLKSPVGIEIFMRLAKSADVIIENMRPDVKHRLGIDYATIRKLNPRIVYGSISGYGEDGPLGHLGCVDQVAQGISGLMSITGEAGGAPLRVGIAISDVASGMALSNGILVALLDRESTGEGAWVRTSLLQAMIAMLDNQAMRYLADGEVPMAVGNDHPVWVPMGTFETSDARYINIFASSQRLFPRFCAVAGLRELQEDPRSKSPESRQAHADFVRGAVKARVRERTADEWIEALNAVGVPCGAILSIDQVFQTPQVEHMNVTRSIDHPTLGPLSLLANAVDIDGASKDIHRPTPEIGEHSRDILGELGYAEDEIAAFVARGVIEAQEMA